MARKAQFLAIDLKSFYASVECVDRGLDPLATHLVVADESRTSKTICLAVSPSLKSLGIKGRPRLFELAEKVAQLNAERRKRAPGHVFSGSSWEPFILAQDSSLAIDHLIAVPRMARYIEVSADIYEIYLRHVAPEDIHVYSIDEVFIDMGPYLHLYDDQAEVMTCRILQDVLRETGITATAGIGTNLYLAKVAMDIVAKKMPENADGVRMASLDERSYRELLWEHEPITDFWQVGPGIARRLDKKGIRNMGDLAACSLKNEGMFYEMFGVNAELLIDHAWGYEPCEISDIKAYRPETRSLGIGQVLQRAYRFDEARAVVWEMADQLALDLVQQGLKTRQLVIHVGYDWTSLAHPDQARAYQGELKTDDYGRPRPKSARGTESFDHYSASGRQLRRSAMALYDRVVDPNFKIRRLQLTCGDVLKEGMIPRSWQFVQQELFGLEEAEDADQERQLQELILTIKGRYGKNAVVKGISLQEGATLIERNQQIGGHRA